MQVDINQNCNEMMDQILESLKVVTIEIRKLKEELCDTKKLNLELREQLSQAIEEISEIKKIQNVPAEIV